MQVFKDGPVTSTLHFVDALEEETSNWLRFVNCSRWLKEQNLVAFQYQKEIFYTTIRDIEPGEELLVWYGDDYGLSLGVSEARRKTMELMKEAGVFHFSLL